MRGADYRRPLPPPHLLLTTPPHHLRGQGGRPKAQVGTQCPEGHGPPSAAQGQQGKGKAATLPLTKPARTFEQREKIRHFAVAGGEGPTPAEPRGARGADGRGSHTDEGPTRRGAAKTNLGRCFSPAGRKKIGGRCISPAGRKNLAKLRRMKEEKKEKEGRRRRGGRGGREKGKGEGEGGGF